jgi:hypothetical protein
MFLYRPHWYLHLAVAALAFSTAAWGHCDSLAGPVVQDARKALESNDVTPVLKWVSAEHEAGIRDAFRRTVAVRGLGNDARDLADRFFFETLVRIHRAGEGEAFTGLKPAGEVDPGIDAADRALQVGTSDDLVRHMSDAVSDGIRTRFAATMERRKHAEENVEAGRAYVQAYVAYIHFVEGVNRLATHGASLKHHEPGQ